MKRFWMTVLFYVLKGSLHTNMIMSILTRLKIEFDGSCSKKRVQRALFFYDLLRSSRSKKHEKARSAESTMDTTTVFIFTSEWSWDSNLAAVLHIRTLLLALDSIPGTLGTTQGPTETQRTFIRHTKYALVCIRERILDLERALVHDHGEGDHHETSSYQEIGHSGHSRPVLYYSRSRVESFVSIIEETSQVNGTLVHPQEVISGLKNMNRKKLDESFRELCRVLALATWGGKNRLSIHRIGSVISSEWVSECTFEKGRWHRWWGTLQFHYPPPPLPRAFDSTSFNGGRRSSLVCPVIYYILLRNALPNWAKARVINICTKVGTFTRRLWNSWRGKKDRGQILRAVKAMRSIMMVFIPKYCLQPASWALQ